MVSSKELIVPYDYNPDASPSMEILLLFHDEYTLDESIFAITIHC